MEDARRAFEALVEGLRGRVASDSTLAERLDGFLSLAQHGEGGVAVENLCSNLYEFEVPLTEPEHSTLVELASRWGVAATTAEELARLKP